MRMGLLNLFFEGEMMNGSKDNLMADRAVGKFFVVWPVLIAVILSLNACCLSLLMPNSIL